MTKSGKWGAVVAGVLAVVIAGGVYWLPNAKSIREHLRDELSRVSGRSVSIDSLDWAWSPSPVLILSGVSVANADWAHAPAMARLPKVTIYPNLGALLERRLVLDKLSIEQPSVFFEKRADGLHNWDDLTTTAKPNSREVSWEFGDVQVEDARVELRHPHGATQYAMRTLSLRSVGQQHSLEAAVSDGNTNPRFVARGTIENLRAMGTSPLRIDMSFDVANGRIKGSYAGTIDRARLTGKMTLNAALPALGDGSNVTLAGGLSGAWARVSLKSTQLLLLHEGERTQGEASLTLDRTRERPLLSGELMLGRVSLPVSDTESSSREAQVVLPELSVDIEVALSLHALTVGRRELGQVRAVVGLEPGRLRLRDSAAVVGGGRVAGEATVHNTQQGSLSASLAVTLNQVASSALLADASSPLVRTHVDGRIEVQTQGERVGQWRKNARGSVRLMSNNGEIKARAVENLVGGVPAIIESLVTGNQEWVHLNCAVVAVDFADSVASVKAVVVDTPNTTMVVEGQARLPSGPLALLVTPHPKSATLNLSLPVRVTGPIDDPSYAAEEAAAARRVGGLLASFVFPPALIAAFADFGYETAGCAGGHAASAVTDSSKVLGRAGAATGAIAREAAEVAREASDVAAEVAKEAGTAASKASDAASKAAESALKEVGRTLRGLFSN